MYEWVTATKVTGQLLSGMIPQVWNMAVFEMNYQVKIVVFENALFNLRWEVRKKTRGQQGKSWDLALLNRQH